MTNISKLVFERQMSMFGHVARFPSEDHARRILSCSNPQTWNRGRVGPPAMWLRQMEGYCRGVETDRVRAWALAQENAKAYRRV